ASPANAMATISGLVMTMVYPDIKAYFESSTRRLTVELSWHEGTKDYSFVVEQWFVQPQAPCPMAKTPEAPTKTPRAAAKRRRHREHRRGHLGQRQEEEEEQQQQVRDEGAAPQQPQHDAEWAGPRVDWAGAQQR